MFGSIALDRHHGMLTRLRRWIRDTLRPQSPPHALRSPEKGRQESYERLTGLPFPDKLPRHEIAPDQPSQRPDDEDG